MSSLIDSLYQTKKITINQPQLPNDFSSTWFYRDFSSAGKREEKDLCFGLGGKISINNIYAESVIWNENKVSVYALVNHLDIVSFNFCGCVMAYFKMSYGKRYAAHIHMPTCKMAWNKYIEPFRDQISELVMFRPDFHEREQIMRVNRKLYGDVQLMGVIDTNLNCYSVCIGLPSKNPYNGEWKVIFIKRHTAPFHVENYLEILKIQDNIDMVWENFWNAQPVREYNQNSKCILA